MYTMPPHSNPTPTDTPTPTSGTPTGNVQFAPTNPPLVPGFSPGTAFSSPHPPNRTSLYGPPIYAAPAPAPAPAPGPPPGPPGPPPGPPHPNPVPRVYLIPKMGGLPGAVVHHMTEPGVEPITDSLRAPTATA